MKELVLKFPFFIPKSSMNINVWNGHVFSYFSVGGKTVYQIRVEGPNVLVEFQFDTNRYLFDDFDTGKSPISKTCHQNFSTATSVTHIDALRVDKTGLPSYYGSKSRSKCLTQIRSKFSF